MGGYRRSVVRAPLAYRGSGIASLLLWIENGDNSEDVEGEYTQTGKSCTVIDYTCVKEKIKDDVTMKVGSRIESDHEAEMD